MLVTIITATYNSEKSIIETLASVSNQSYSNIEHIIVDGASADSTLSLISRNASNNIRIISEKDTGIYEALNKGINLARGEIIGFLHAGDRFGNDETINNIVRQFTLNMHGKNDSIGVYGDLIYYSPVNEKKVRYWKSGIFQAKLIRYGWMPPHPTLFLHKSVYDKIGGYSEKYKISGDYEFILRLFQCKPLNMVYYPHVITEMSIGGESNKSIKNIINTSAVFTN